MEASNLSLFYGLFILFAFHLMDFAKSDSILPSLLSAWTKKQKYQIHFLLSRGAKEHLGKKDFQQIVESFKIPLTLMGKESWTRNKTYDCNKNKTFDSLEKRSKLYVMFPENVNETSIMLTYLSR